MNARVVMVVEHGFEVVINRGRRDGVTINERYVVYSTGPELFDPDTDESLGSLEMVRGTGYVTQVQEKISVLKSMETKRVPRPLLDSEMRVSASNAFARLAGVSGPREYVNESAPFNKPMNGDFARRV